MWFHWLRNYVGWGRGFFFFHLSWVIITHKATTSVVFGLRTISLIPPLFLVPSFLNPSLSFHLLRVHPSRSVFSLIPCLMFCVHISLFFQLRRQHRDTIQSGLELSWIRLHPYPSLVQKKFRLQIGFIPEIFWKTQARARSKPKPEPRPNKNRMILKKKKRNCSQLFNFCFRGMISLPWILTRAHHTECLVGDTRGIHFIGGILEMESLVNFKIHQLCHVLSLKLLNRDPIVCQVSAWLMS